MVIDASALLAFLFREPGADRVTLALPDGCISAVNLSEVAGRFLRDGHDLSSVKDRLSRLPLEVVPFDRHAAFATAALLPATAHLGLSLGDRACLALAKQRNLTALTADRDWLQVPGIQVESIR